MFRVLELRDGKVDLHEGTDHVGPPPAGVVRWIDLRSQDEAQLELLRERFNFHPLAIEDCAHEDQRPKLEEYHIFLVTQGFACAGARVEELELQELHTFLGDGWMVTVHLGNIAALEKTWRRLSGEPKLLERGVDFAYYLVADGIVDDNFPIIDHIADELEELEDAVLSSPHTWLPSALSSNTMRSGRPTKERATRSRRCCPPESPPHWTSATSPSPKSSMSWPTSRGSG